MLTPVDVAGLVVKEIVEGLKVDKVLDHLEDAMLLTDEDAEREVAEELMTSEDFGVRVNVELLLVAG